MGDATRTYFLKVFAETLEILDANEVPYLVIGSIATSAHLGDDWNSASDIDLLMERAQAERCLDIFPSHGYAVHVRDPGWIFKVAKPNVTIDLIFRSEGRIEMGAEILDHACTKPFEGLTLRVPSVEDMAIHYTLMDTDERQGHWYDAMRYLRRVEDWDYLAQRARALGPGKTLAALLYAADVGIEVPRTSIQALASSCFG